jgi:hypothetical protein
MSLNAIATPAALEPAPLVTRCRRRTVAKVDSIGFGVRRWPSARRAVAEGEQQGELIGNLRGHVAPYSRHTPAGGLGVLAVLDVSNLGERGLGARLRRLGDMVHFTTLAISSQQHRCSRVWGEDLPDCGPEPERHVTDRSTGGFENRKVVTWPLTAL